MAPHAVHTGTGWRSIPTCRPKTTSARICSYPTYSSGTDESIRSNNRHDHAQGPRDAAARGAQSKVPTYRYAYDACNSGTAQARHCSHDLPPVGGKWSYWTQHDSLSQKKTPAGAATTEQCQLHAWQWISNQLEGTPCTDPFSSRGVPQTWGQLRRPGMRWHGMVRRVTIAPWILQSILRPCRHSLMITGSEAGMGSSVRNACSGTALMQQWPTTPYDSCWRSFSPCKEPPSSCPAGSGVRPSSNQTFIMPSQISLAVSSGHWFRNTFLMSGHQRPHRNQGLRRTKDAEATSRKNDIKGDYQILNFPPVGGMPDGDKICQIMALRGHLRARGSSIQGKGLGSWETNSRARTCAMTITSQRRRKLHQPLLWTSAWYHGTTPCEPGTPRTWNERCGVLGILSKTRRNNYRTCSRRCRPKGDWNCSCGHGNMWTVVSKYSYSMTLQLSLAFQCGSSYMPWKQQKLCKNARSMIHTWQPNPVTMGNPTTEQRKAGRDPNTHSNSNSRTQALGQEREHAKGDGKNGQALTSDTMAVDWGKRARRGKSKRAYKRIKRATDRLRFWYPRQCRATLRYDGLCFLMYSLACIRLCWNMFYVLLAGNLALARGAPEVRVAAHTSGAVRVNLVHERAGDSGRKQQATPTRFTWTAKRAFRRARARAREGPTWYRGKWHNADTLNALHGISSEQGDNRRTCKKDTYQHKQHNREKRVRVLSINVGGMTTATWNELNAWLNIAEPDRFDIITIQETRWKHNSEFNSGPWTVVGTGCAEGDRCAGVLIMVHQRLGNSQCVLRREILKGRMLHVRVLSGPTAIDIVNKYQHVWRTQYDQEKNMECRMRVWNALRKTVAQLPLRNAVVWCGDNNLAANTCLPHVGTSILTASDKQQADEQEFYGILQQYGLCVLNTWSNHTKSSMHNQWSVQPDRLHHHAHAARGSMRKAKQFHA